MFVRFLRPFHDRGARPGDVLDLPHAVAENLIREASCVAVPGPVELAIAAGPERAIADPVELAIAPAVELRAGHQLIPQGRPARPRSARKA